MGVIDEIIFTSEMLALVNRALEAPEEEKDAYVDEVVGRCYAHDMCRAIDDCPTTLITCAAARAFMHMFRSEKFKEHHKAILNLLLASLNACIEDAEDAKRNTSD